MSVSSRAWAIGWEMGVAYLTAVNIGDAQTRYPSNGHGVGTGTASASAVLSSSLCALVGVYLSAGSVVGAGRLFFEDHNGVAIYMALNIPASVPENRYYRFGHAGILIPGPWRMRWVATIGGTTGPAHATVFYQDYSKRSVN